jgi:hypothetical protein
MDKKIDNLIPGVVTQELWSDPKFRSKMYDTIFDAGLTFDMVKLNQFALRAAISLNINPKLLAN